MRFQYIAPAILLLASACSSNLTTAGGPSAAEKSTIEQMERDSGHSWPPSSRFRRPSYPRRDT